MNLYQRLAQQEAAALERLDFAYQAGVDASDEFEEELEEEMQKLYADEAFIGAIEADIETEPGYAEAVADYLAAGRQQAADNYLQDKVEVRVRLRAIQILNARDAKAKDDYEAERDADREFDRRYPR